MNLSSDKLTGKLKSAPNEDVLKKIKSLKSFLRYSSFYEDAKPGDEIKQTIDLATATGYVLLANPDYDIVESDYCTLLDLQKHIFDII